MATSKQPRQHEDTLEHLLDRVSNAREELVAIERSLERLRANIAKNQTETLLRQDSLACLQLSPMEVCQSHPGATA